MIASLLFRRRHRRFVAALEAPLATQAERLREILGRAAHTEVGRSRGFARIARIPDHVDRIEAFREAIPIRTYAGMRDDLDAVYHGNWQRLCPSRPLFFAMTAGSTGQFKHVPFTDEFRRELREGAMVFSGAMQASYPAVRALTTQFLVGSAEGGASPAGIPQGFASGFNYRNFPWLVRRRFIVPYWVFTIDDVNERNYAAGRILAAARRVGALCAISPVNLINLRRALDANAERLCDDIAAGTLEVRSRSAVPGRFRTRPDPGFADTLRTAWKREGTLPTRRLFPSLEVLVCWQGGNMGYSLDELRSAFGIDRLFEFPVSASEGVFAIPHRTDRPGGVVAITCHFFEFVPEGDDTRTLRTDQLEVGGEYRIVVTNGGGLYRYDMEDIVRVTEIVGRTPAIEFVSRAGRRISVSNERITELDVSRAMEATSRVCGAWFDEFLFVPCTDRRYRVLLDGREVSALDELRIPALAVELERQLRLAAKGYDFEREDALLEALQVVVTAPGALTECLQAMQGAPPIPSAQLKPVRLTREFDLHHRIRIGGTDAA